MRSTKLVALVFGLLLLAVPTAAAHSGAHGAKQGNTAGYAMTLKIDQLKPQTGQLRFTITPEGFTFKKVPYRGSRNVQGQGHAHLYAIAEGKRRGTYIGWTGSGPTSWTDKKMLKKGTTYRIFAVFSSNDHTEDRKIQSNWVKVAF
jgi:hypothetical protein